MRFLFYIFCFARWLSFAAQSFFLAIGKAVRATTLSICTALVIPLILIGAFYPLELTGLWLNTPVTYFAVGILAAVLLVLFAKKLRRSSPAEPPQTQTDGEEGGPSVSDRD